jgi:cytochrome c biogenesis protein CcmG/thiol:disulfide interchange protein DsbE
MTAKQPSTGSFLGGLLRDWGVALALAILAFAGYNFFFAPKPPALGPSVDFTLATPAGQSFTLSSATADPIVLNFWFTTCPPCRAEIPELSAWAKAHPDVPLYGVSTDVGMPPGRLQREAERLGVTYPVLHDVRAEVAGRFGIDVFPTTLVISHGQIVASRVGRVDGKALDEMVAKAR